MEARTASIKNRYRKISAIQKNTAFKNQQFFCIFFARSVFPSERKPAEIRSTHRLYQISSFINKNDIHRQTVRQPPLIVRYKFQKKNKG